MKSILFILLLIQCTLHQGLRAQNAVQDQWVIVLDAGHGGKDPGAVGKRSHEKDIVLDIVLRVGKYLKANFSDIKVVYTRSTDVFIELEKRARIANDVHADLFVSVHCNANAKTSPNGTEVFVMGPEKTEANLAVAMKENSVALLEDNHEENYDGIDPNSAEAYIAFSVFQNMYIERSLKMAQFTMKHMNKQVGLLDRGTKQAPFFVLYKTAMPAILIETGFISNLSDEAILMSDAGKEKIAYAIYLAITDYRNETENASFKAGPMNQIGTSTDTAATANATGIIFKVQFASFKEVIAISDKRFAGLGEITYQKSGEYYKYYCGSTTSYSDISTILAQAKTKGYSDAFIVAFKNGQQISVQDARKQTGQ